MKTIQYIVTSIFVFIALIASAVSVQATVGGPTYIGNFSYNKADESVYFISNSLSGRGCPPLLGKISLLTEKTSEVITCDQAERMIGNDYSNGATVVLNEISRITSSFRILSPLSLSKNNIKVDVNYISAEMMEGFDEPVRRNFVVKVFQSGIKIDEFALTGCNTNQPFTFAGYAIPTLEKKIILLSSTKGDCFEGGYIGERLLVIGGVNNLDKSYATNSYKTYQTGLTPDEATLTVYEKDSVTEVKPTQTPGSSVSTSAEPTESGTPTQSTNTASTTTIVIIVLLALILGVLIGRAVSKR
jgi:hypothetical protein